VKWALVGASDIAATRMIPAIRGRGDEVVAVISRDADRGIRFATDNEIAHATTDLDAVLADDAVEAVYISSRNHLHAAQSAVALAAGKHVLSEKPMAISSEQAQLVLDAAASSRVTFAVNHHLPGAATHRTIRRLINEGAIGRPLAISVCHAVVLPDRLRGWRLGRDAGSGVALDITCHDASVINAALGRPASIVTAVGVAQGNWAAGSADAVMSSMTYGDVTVQTHDAFTIGYRPTRFDVFGTDGAILAHDVMTQDPVGEVVLRTVSGEKSIDVGERADLYTTVLDAFADAIAGTGEPTVSGADGANAFIVAQAVSDAAASERAVSIDHWFAPDPHAHSRVAHA
jgi:1,5-anhydro-D-fructose reductase (1,5-anhydro-D-mannitol-forming)